MRAVVQRVTEASVEVDGRCVGRIERGLVVLLGVAVADGLADVEWVAGKVRDLRVFEDEAGRMNRSIVGAGGAVLLVSQFTLLGDCRKGRRPSLTPPRPRSVRRRSTRTSPAACGPTASGSRPDSSAPACRSGWSTTGP